MSKEQMKRARELILQKRYDAARAILQQIDHPAAQQWLAKLDQIAPAAGPVSESQASETATTEEPTSREQLGAARELIVQKRFDAARAMLQQIDDPTARRWLAKLDEIAPERKAELPRAQQEEKLIEAQHLILDNDFSAAQGILEHLTIPEAVIWRHKTQMNKFREFQSVWLDMYYYDLDVEAAGAALEAWRCDVCGRDAQQARLCPQRGHGSCPVKLRERPIKDPHRLALMLGGIHMGETRNVKPLLKGVTVQQLNHWRQHLEYQLAHVWEQDIRRPTLETAVILLHQLEETRKLAATGMGSTASAEAEAPEPLPEAPVTSEPAGAGDAEVEDKDGAMRDALKRLGKLLGGSSREKDG